MNVAAFGLERFEAARHRRAIDRFAQHAHRSVAQRLAAHRFRCESGDEDDRQRNPAVEQAPLHLEPGHAGHLHVGDDAHGIANLAGCEEIFGGRIEPDRPTQ